LPTASYVYVSRYVRIADGSLGSGCGPGVSSLLVGCPCEACSRPVAVFSRYSASYVNSWSGVTTVLL
jgi:hypothetical protein